MSFKKSDIDRHGGYPAINVKVHSIDYSYTQAVMEKFKCSDDVATRALDWALETSKGMFWDNIETTVEETLGRKVKVWQEGRSGGWLVVDCLPDVESWDAILVSAWGRLEKAIKFEIEYLTSLDKFMEDIEENRWAEEYAEQYNFISTDDGGMKCAADANRIAAEARKAFLES